MMCHYTLVSPGSVIPMPFRWKAQGQVTVGVPGAGLYVSIRCHLSGWSHPAVPSLIGRPFLLRRPCPLPSPPSHHACKGLCSHTSKWKCSELPQKRSWTWIISQSSSGQGSAGRTGQAAVPEGKGTAAGPGAQEGGNAEPHPRVIFVISVSLCSYLNIILAICKIPHVQLWFASVFMQQNVISLCSHQLLLKIVRGSYETRKNTLNWCSMRK